MIASFGISWGTVVADQSFLVVGALMLLFISFEATSVTHTMLEVAAVQLETLCCYSYGRHALNREFAAS